jgi:hypothetical protein
MTFSPNLKVLPDWRSTVTVAFSILRRISFITLPDFQFGDFDPATNFSTMAATAYEVKRARFLRINKFLWFSIDLRATLAAVFVQAITITLPATAAGDSTTAQGVSGIGENAGAGEGSLGIIVGETSTLQIYRPSIAAYSAGNWKSRINGFIEVV